jgi:hypothetical protein
VEAWIDISLNLTYGKVHVSKPLVYLYSAADAVSVSLAGGLLNGLVAQLSEEGGRGKLLDITQLIIWLTSHVITLVHDTRSLVSLSALFY